MADHSEKSDVRVARVVLESEYSVGVLLEHPESQSLGPEDFSFRNGITIHRFVPQTPNRVQLIAGPFELSQNYRMRTRSGKSYPVLPTVWLDRLQLADRYGHWWRNHICCFRLHAPRSIGAQLFLYSSTHDKSPRPYSMEYEKETGSWFCEVPDLSPGMLYAFSIESAFRKQSPELFADPWSKAVAKTNNWQRTTLSLVLPPAQQTSPPVSHVNLDPRDQVIYETHVKDFTALSDEVPEHLRGTYLGMVYDTPNSPLQHLKKLGINTVELLPVADYDYYEPDFDDPGLSVHNTWNPYARNHWGYMSAHFFSPDARYATDQSHLESEWIGEKGNQRDEFKQMVQGFHDNGIAVLLDVVYNHVAQYSANYLRKADAYSTLRHRGSGNLTNDSGCGNDLRTESPYVRKLIIDSLKHWVTEYGVDGFRFDLAGIIDDDTLNEITTELKSVYPGIHLIAEPWGGRYDRYRFSVRDWGSWNDMFRNGICGYHPSNARGIVFGRWFPGENHTSLYKLLSGDLTSSGGSSLDEYHSVNYLASHDGYNFGDFVRSANGHRSVFKAESRDDCFNLTTLEQSRLFLGLFLLIVSRGRIMIHQGDEWAHCKWIQPGKHIDDPDSGKLDHNSYNKDNETNWLHWDDLSRNVCKQLSDYASGLLALRKQHDLLRYTRTNHFRPLHGNTELAQGGFELRGINEHMLILVNAHVKEEATFALPRGRWKVLADHKRASATDAVGGIRTGSTTLPATSGALLVRSL